MKDYADNAGRKWKTAIVVVQDENGRVFVDNSVRHFKDQISRAATSEDALYMLAEARREFEVEQTARIVAVELNRLLKKQGG